MIDALKTAGVSVLYISHRLALAGCATTIFASDALTMIHEATGGAMRDVDRIATAAMRVAARKKRKIVDRDAMAHVIEADVRARA